MTTLTQEKETNTDILERCDQCIGQAYVVVTGITGELVFCAHHFSKIEKNEEAFEKLKAFAFVIKDQRDRLSTKRAGL